MGLHAKTQGYWAAAFLTYLEFVHAFLKNSSNIYAIYVNTKQSREHKTLSSRFENANTKQY